MKSKKAKSPVKPDVKPRMHERNKHHNPYNFATLITHVPELEPYVVEGRAEVQTIDFADATAVKLLNKAILIADYGLKYWDIPENYLCPPIPGRSDYLHYLADILRNSNYGKIPQGETIKGLDIGVGANCIYPLLGHQLYGWEFIGSDIDASAIANAQSIIDGNKGLENHINLRIQPKENHFFTGVIKQDEMVDFTMCNPPFHASEEEAKEANIRKVSNLKGTKGTLARNFGGSKTELWCKGGEKQFVLDMIRESRQFSSNCYWFSTLISKQNNLKPVRKALEAIGVEQIITIPVGHGNKSSRIIAWSFLNQKAAAIWRNARWNLRKKV